MPMPIASDRVAVLTPDPADNTYADSWPGVLERLSAALSAEGVTATPTPWTAHIDDCAQLQAFPLVLPLLACGYHLHPERWLRACPAARRAGVEHRQALPAVAGRSRRRDPAHHLDRARHARAGAGAVRRHRRPVADRQAHGLGRRVEDPAPAPRRCPRWRTRRRRDDPALP